MKKSEKLRIEAEQEENDLKALGLHTKVLRQKKNEDFEEKWLPRLEANHICQKGTNQSYVIYSTRFGVIDYFPKANKALLRRKQRWIKPALQWIVKNLILPYENRNGITPVAENAQ